MRLAPVFLLLALLFAPSAFSQPYAPPVHDTCESALALEAENHIAGVEMEYDWLRQHYPYHHKVSQDLIECSGKLTDVFELRSPDGRIDRVYFDLSGYFGKGWDLPE